MKQRGRKSLEQQSLTVVAPDFGKFRPDPPDDLTDGQKEIWRVTCEDEPLTHFSTNATQKLLRDYVVAREWIEGLQGEMQAFKLRRLRTAEGRAAFTSMSKALDLYVRMSTTLATKLRITNTSRYTPLAAATASRNTAKGAKPWGYAETA